MGWRPCRDTIVIYAEDTAVVTLRAVIAALLMLVTLRASDDIDISARARSMQPGEVVVLSIANAGLADNLTGVLSASA